jgi:hypothetical protein
MVYVKVCPEEMAHCVMPTAPSMELAPSIHGKYELYTGPGSYELTELGTYLSDACHASEKIAARPES